MKPKTKMNITCTCTCHVWQQQRHANSEDACLAAYHKSHARSGRKSTWVARPHRRAAHLLTWPADVLNLQVFVGGRAGVSKQTVRRDHATLGPILAPRQKRQGAPPMNCC